MIAPYWTSPDGTIVVYNARWEDVLAAGLVPVRKVALIHADGPYGVSERTERATAGRLGNLGRESQKLRTGRKVGHVCDPKDWPAIVGDADGFDPAPLLMLQRPSVLWGANHYAPRVPESPSWILWDKREDQTPDDNADGELAWTNLGGPLRIFRHWWRGALRKTEKVEGHLHPTQKPIALSAYVFRRAKLQRGNLVFVPYGGSGPDLPACVAAGLRLIWCEVDRGYCDTAIARLRAVVPERAAETIPGGALPMKHPPERSIVVTRDTREPHEHAHADMRDPCAICGAAMFRACEPVFRPWVFAPGIGREVPYADRPRVYLPTVRGKIDEGDYAPAGMEAHVSIEFKRGPDLISTLFGEREGGDSCGERAPNLERFRAELEKAQASRAFFGIVVGASEGWIFTEAKRRFAAYGKSYDPFNVFDLLRGFRTDLGVWTLFAGSLELAELEVGATLTRIWSQATNGMKARGARKRGYGVERIPWLGAVLPVAEAEAAE